jgi:hypothetical protein
VVDGVPQLIMISAAVGGDCLPYSVSYCILVSGLECCKWSFVSAKHIGSADDLHNCLVLFLAGAWNSLDSKLYQSGAIDAVQQIPQSASEDRGFISKSVDLVGVVELLVLLGIAPRSVVFFFFFFLIVFFLPLVMVIVLRHLLSFLHVFPCRYCEHNLEWFILPRRVVLWLLLRQHIPWC